MWQRAQLEMILEYSWKIRAQKGPLHHTLMRAMEYPSILFLLAVTDKSPAVGRMRCEALHLLNRVQPRAQVSSAVRTSREG